MPPRYFYGRSVFSNRVTASSARNFPTLVKQHLEGSIRLQHTQEEYLALDPKDRLKAKDTFYLVGCTFKEDDAERSHGNALNCCNLLFLDLDDSSSAAPLLRNPDDLRRRLAPFNFAAYTTASSTPRAPRLRVVVDAEAIPLSRYPDAVRTIAQALGIMQPTKESLIPNQPMICPSLFKGQDEDIEHPVFATHLSGRSFTLQDIVSSTPSKEVAGPIEDYGEEDGLEYLRAPLMGLTLDKVKGALDTLSPDMSYPEWVEVAAALRHQFSHSEPDAAYEMFDTWSSKGRKYAGEDDTLTKWNSVKPTPRGRLPITIRTLIKRAADAGWSAGEVKETCFDAVMDWIGLKAKTRHDLTHVALEKIAGLPMLTSVEEEMLLRAIVKQVSDTRKESISVGTLRKDLNRIQSAKDRIKDEEVRVKEHPWTKGWCYVTTTEQFFRHSSHERMTGMALNAAFGRYLLPTEEQLEKAGKEVTEAALHTPLFQPMDYLLHHRQCLVVHDFEYDPSSPKDIYIENEDGVRFVNTYRKSYAKADPSQADAAAKLLMEHLENLILEEEYRVTLLDYIAYNVQSPGCKIRWCPLIQGAEGCGKTLMARLLEAVLGVDNVALVNNDSIRSQWNDWAFGHQMIVIPEAYVSGKGRMDTMNRLKDLVTDDRISINQRNRSTRTVINRSNYIMFTNHHDALILMNGSRRYFIIKSPLQTEEQVKALGDDYFERMFGMIQQNAAGLRAFFEEWEISDDFPADGRAPKTRYLEEMIEDAADEETSTVRRLIREGTDPVVTTDLVCTGRLRSAMEAHGVRVTGQTIAAILRAENYQKAGDLMVNGERDHLWMKAGAFPSAESAKTETRKRLETPDDL